MKRAWAIVPWFAAASFSQPIIVDHTCIGIFQIPAGSVEAAKERLHIAYGYTSHGSQIVSGMSGLVDFMNGRGTEHDLFAFNEDGSGGALHLTSGDGNDRLENDAGYYPDWVNETRSFLGDPDGRGRGSSHPEFNVIMWAWCGQLSGYGTDDVNRMYLDEMNRLERDYPGVTFVYMTGHSDGSGLEGDLHRNNRTILDYCIRNEKVLFDFYDIECYDPDGNYFGDRHVNDACDYDGGNWAREWQDRHTEGVDWYACDAAHTEPVNGNMKARAAWWLWARLGGWGGPVSDPTPPTVPGRPRASVSGPTTVDLAWDPSTDSESGVSLYRIYRDGTRIGSSTSTAASDPAAVPGRTHEYRVTAVNGAGTESGRSAAATATLPADALPPSTPGGLTAVPFSSSRIDLAWDASTDNTAVALYRITRNGEEAARTEETFWSDTGLSPKTEYVYRVSAVDAAGNESDPSDPVSAATLDPDLTPNTVRLENTDEVDDTYIFESDPEANFGGECCLGEIDRFLIRFALPPNLAGKRILSADLELFVWNQSDYHAGESLKVHLLTRSWDENGATWLNARDGVPWSSPGGDADPAGPVASIPHRPDPSEWDHAFYPAADVTPEVQAWVDGTVPNFGFLVIRDGQTEIGLKSSEYEEGSRPRLEITWTDPPAPGGVDAGPAAAFRLLGCYPNPFNSGTTIRFDLASREDVEIRVFDLRGREVGALAAGFLEAGPHGVRFSADRLASGLFVYSIRAGSGRSTGKMLLTR
jgi:hypothetical protein